MPASTAMPRLLSLLHLKRGPRGPPPAIPRIYEQIVPPPAPHSVAGPKLDAALRPPPARVPSCSGLAGILRHAPEATPGRAGTVLKQRRAVPPRHTTQPPRCRAEPPLGAEDEEEEQHHYVPAQLPSPPCPNGLAIVMNINGVPVLCPIGVPALVTVASMAATVAMNHNHVGGGALTRFRAAVGAFGISFMQVRDDGDGILVRGIARGTTLAEDERVVIYGNNKDAQVRVAYLGGPMRYADLSIAAVVAGVVFFILVGGVCYWYSRCHN